MKKKIIIIISIIVLIAVAIGCAYAVDMHRMKNNKPVVFSTWGYDFAPPLLVKVITPEVAVKTVKETLDEKSLETILNYDNPKIEEIAFETNPSIYYLDEKTDVVGREIYKITFNTTQDGLLGPIVFYVDKENGNIIGMDYRE